MCNKSNLKKKFGKSENHSSKKSFKKIIICKRWNLSSFIIKAILKLQELRNCKLNEKASNQLVPLIKVKYAYQRMLLGKKGIKNTKYPFIKANPPEHCSKFSQTTISLKICKTFISQGKKLRMRNPKQLQGTLRSLILLLYNRSET